MPYWCRSLLAVNFFFFFETRLILFSLFEFEYTIRIKAASTASYRINTNTYYEYILIDDYNDVDKIHEYSLVINR